MRKALLLSIIFFISGDRQLFTFERIEKISRDYENDSYDVSLRVIGFEGPLNPPFKLIRMTIRIPGEKYTKYSVLSYKHRYVSDKELDKLTKYYANNIEAKIKTEIIPQNHRPSVMELAFLRYLGGTILEIMDTLIKS